MANEELVQRKYLATGELKGDKFDGFEELNVGATSVSELAAAGVAFTGHITPKGDARDGTFAMLANRSLVESDRRQGQA